MDAIRQTLLSIVVALRPMTVRQVFYQAVSRGIVGKSEAEYNGTVCRLLKELRLDGSIPFDWIADNTRWVRKPATFDSVRDILAAASQQYRRDPWKDQDCYIEIWLEKDALAGVIETVTKEYAVPLMVSRGYSSLSYLNAAAAELAQKECPVYILNLGDWDPSGLDISRNTEERLREFAPDCDLRFERLAVTEAQIAEMDLPLRPTKETDSRSKNFQGGSVEVDAIGPDLLRAMVRRAILGHIDQGRWEDALTRQEKERDALVKFADQYDDDDDE